LREEVFNQQQVVEFERQRGAAHGDDLFFQGVILLVLCGALRAPSASDCSEQCRTSQTGCDLLAVCPRLLRRYSFAVRERGFPQRVVYPLFYAAIKSI
jgi:hypothetical protein